LPVPREDFSDAALVLLGHGSTKNAESSAPVYQHAAGLRRQNIFAAVREAFWKQEPQVKPVLAGLTAPRAFIVPLFISEGHFSSQVIPKELGFLPGQSTINHQPSTIFYCRPVGTHDAMTRVVLARAREVVADFPFPGAPGPEEITLVIAGHGTGQNENSRKAIERQVALVRALNIFADVHGVFMEEEPRIADCYALARTRSMVVVPYFISDGMHVREDIPMLLGEPERIVRQRRARGQSAWRNPTEQKGRLVWYSGSVGTHPQVAGIILERVREAAAGGLPGRG
jgi:sirohydrochlorin cobaltochelatase